MLALFDIVVILTMLSSVVALCSVLRIRNVDQFTKVLVFALIGMMIGLVIISVVMIVVIRQMPTIS